MVAIDLKGTSVVHVNYFIDNVIAVKHTLNSQLNKFLCTFLQTIDAVSLMLLSTDIISHKEATSTTNY
jgi:hypothetical protein